MQVSVGGGVFPHWSADGSELFYRRLSDWYVMGIPIVTDTTFEPGLPVVVLGKPYASGDYDVAPDGRFLMMARNAPDGETRGPRINVVLNWFEELKERVPGGR